mgnify:CR=1 FL=1
MAVPTSEAGRGEGGEERYGTVSGTSVAAAAVAGAAAVLAEGRTLTSGTFREVAANADVMRAYLGKIVTA